MNSRWSTHPIKRGGKVVSIRPKVAGDIEILKCLGRYSLLTPEDIAALTGRSYKAIIARLSLLKRDPYRLITVHGTQLQSPHIYQWTPQVFHLTPAGIARLREEGAEAKDRGTGHFKHSITQAQTAASFEVGARGSGLEHVVVDQTSITVTFALKGKTYNNHTVLPDGGPIGLGYGNDMWRFVVFETDCATEPLTSSNRDRQAIETKFAAYLTILSGGLYEAHWQIPNLTILFTTTTKARLESMRELLHSMSDRYLNSFRFVQFPTILDGEAQPTTRAWAVTLTGLDKR